MDQLESAKRDFNRLLWVVGFFSIFTNLLMLSIPLYMLQIYDRVLPSQSSATLAFLTMLAFLALLVLGAMESVRSILANRMAARFDASLGDSVLRHVIRDGAASGGSSQPVRDVAAIRSLIGSRQSFAILDMPFAAIFVGLMYFIHPSLFWITLAGAVILALIALLNQYLSRKPALRQNETGIATGFQTEYLARNADSLVAMGMVSNVVDNWGRSHSVEMIEGDRLGRISAIFTGISRFFRLGLQIVIQGYGALLVLDGQMTAGMIFASSIVSGRALQPIDQVIGSWRQTAAGYQSWKRLCAFLSGKRSLTAQSPLPRPKGTLQVAGIFQPNPQDPAGNPILAGISFNLEAGKSVAILGPSGSGKTTLARIIVGARKAMRGTVRIDGHDIANWDSEALGAHIGYLAQDVELLPGTIAQNISRFSPNPDPQKYMDAARLAHAEELIKAMPKGYDTLIGPGGVQISGGEKQRIGLARAFYGDPCLLVLDEPNSSLDKIGEKALNHALSEAGRKGITVIIVTQRESALAGVDKIMRMAKGRILDFDDRDKILAKFGQPGPGRSAGEKNPTPQLRPTADPSPNLANAPTQKARPRPAIRSASSEMPASSGRQPVSGVAPEKRRSPFTVGNQPFGLPVVKKPGGKGSADDMAGDGKKVSSEKGKDDE